MAKSGKGQTIAFGALAGLLLLVLAYAGLLYFHVQAVTYFKHSPSTWPAIVKSSCVHWQDKYVFGDLRPGSKNEFAPLELSCKQAMQLPSESHYVTNPRGQKIRYLRYNQLSNKAGRLQADKRPILLFVHGIAVNYVTGLKFYPLAKRLGFELVVMELSNHGWSDDDGTGAAYGCRESADLVAVLQDLIKQDPQRPILVFGTSMGAMTIADASAELSRFQGHLKAVVLENPQSSLRDILGVYASHMHLPDFHTDLVAWLTGLRAHQDYSECAPYKRVEKMPYPTWVEISEIDFMVPTWMAKKVYDHLPKRPSNLYTQFPYGEHGAVWNGQPEAFEAALSQFWQASLAQAKPLT